MSNPFFFKAEEYPRDLNVVANYIATAAKHISIQTGCSVEEAAAFVAKRLEEQYQPKSPSMSALQRPLRGDREKRRIDFLGYLKWVQQNKHIMTPNMIAYANPDVEESYAAGFIDMNLKLRSKIKKDGQLAEMRGDKDYAEFCDLGQSNAKIRNNSVSGATSSPHNALYYGTAHTTLTSTCRAVTSYANATNEKMLASNRHYYSPEVVLENIAYIVRVAPYEYIIDALDKFDLVIPSVDDAMERVLAASREYWKSDIHEAIIRRSLEGLTPYELAAFVYCGDFLALCQLNEGPMRYFFRALMDAPRPYAGSLEDAKAIIKSADSDVITMVGLLCYNFLKGKVPQDIIETEEENYRIYVARILRAKDHFEHYAPMVRAFWSTMIMAPNIHSITTVIRKAVVASDTDSSIFSTRNIVKWFTGTDRFNYSTICVSAVAGYIVSQTVAHTLAVLCKQMGVVDRDLFRLTMKNEFLFPIVTVTTRTKHYMAIIAAKEGNVYGKEKTEIKGVALKSSKIPVAIRNAAAAYHRAMMDKINGEDQTLTPFEIMAVPATLEHYIKGRIATGDSAIYRRSQVKPMEGYKKPMSSVYVYSELWNAVFGAKYGYIEQLPCDMVAVKVNIPNKTALAAWAAQLEPTMRDALLKWCSDMKRDKFTQILVPTGLLDGGRIPEEIRLAVNTPKLLKDLMDPFYIAAEAYGITVLNPKLTRFFSDDMTAEEAREHLMFNPLENMAA